MGPIHSEFRGSVRNCHHFAKIRKSSFWAEKKNRKSAKKIFFSGLSRTTLKLPKKSKNKNSKGDWDLLGSNNSPKKMQMTKKQTLFTKETKKKKKKKKKKFFFFFFFFFRILIFFFFFF